MKYLPLIGRILFTLPFLMAGPSHFTAAAIGFATMQGVPLASFLVPFSGLLAFAGGLSVLLGYKAKWGAWLLVAFLLPVTFMMHNFWAATNPVQQQMGMAIFFKNISMVGIALFIAYIGAGPVSFDARVETKASLEG